MARLILLDGGPLGLILRAPSKPQVGRCLAWLNTVMTNAAIIVIPEIAHYEVRRKHPNPRVGSLRRLDHALDPSSGFDHLALTTDAIIKAAEFWAFLRQTGVPTLGPTLWMPMPSLPVKRRSPVCQVIPSRSRRRTCALSRFPGIDAQNWDQIR